MSINFAFSFLTSPKKQKPRHEYEHGSLDFYMRSWLTVATLPILTTTIFTTQEHFLSKTNHLSSASTQWIYTRWIPTH